MAPVPYHAGTVPESFALLYTNQDSATMRETGLFEQMRVDHDERADLHYLANAGGQPSMAYRFYLKEPIESADLSGLKIRVSGATAPVVEALGGTPVSIPYADTYTALERGVVDGFGATYTGVVEPGLHEVISYVLQEPFYSLNAPILVNNDVWEGLSQEVKDELERIAPIYESAVEEYTSKSLATEDEALRGHGVEYIELPEVESEKFRETVQNTGWDAYMGLDPEGGEDLRALAMQ
jgi:TRAP-type C4-dicarboxylate transport system substrate-binding protein